MIISSLTMCNFLSHVDTTISFTEYSGLVLIEGINVDGHYSSNGSGKSTILEGIVYSITGNTLRGSPVSELVNRNFGKNMKVSLEFLIDKVKYTITRYRKDSVNGDKVFLYKDGVDITRRVNKDTQEDIDNLVGVPSKILLSTILMGEGLTSRFTQLSDTDKKYVIESTLNLGYDINSVRIKASSQLSACNSKLAETSGSLATLANIANKGFTEESLADAIATSRRKIDDAKIELASVMDSLKSAHAYMDSMNNKYKVLADAKNTIETYLNMKSMKEREILNHKSSLNALEKVDHPICEVCHQSIVDENAMAATRYYYDSLITVASNELTNIYSKLNEYPDVDIINSKLATTTNLCRELQNNYTLLSENKTSLEVAISVASKDIENYSHSMKELQELSSNMTKLEELAQDYKNSIDMYKYLVDLYSPKGIILYVLQEAINYINDRLSVYTSILLNTTYKLSVASGKVVIENEKGSSYQSLSNGEKRRLDIAIQLSLHDYVHIYCSMKINCCFIDEVLDTLDEIGVNNITEVLKMKIEYCNLTSIYVITHNNELKDQFDRIITVTKNREGNSYIS